MPNHLDVLKEMKTTPYYAALLKLFDNEAARQLSEIVVAQSEAKIRQLQGGVMTIEGLRKVLDDIDLLRSLQGNPNVDPVSDKE